MSIPKKIHYCWFGGGEKPHSVKKCINSWKKYCPDYEIIEWNESNLDMNLNAFAARAYQEKAWGFVPDFYRLWIIYNHGGIYLDTDVQMIRSFDSLLDKPAFAGLEFVPQTHSHTVSLGLGFGAEKGNPLIGVHLKLYDEIPLTDEHGNFNRTASPKYTTDLLMQYGLDNCKNEIQDLGDMVIYPVEYFCPKDFMTGITRCTPNTYSIHQFDASWFDEDTAKWKQDNWRRAKKAARKEFWKYLPNRVLLKLLGRERYEKLKSIRKGT